jgi:hypothetical protein
MADISLPSYLNLSMLFNRVLIQNNTATPELEPPELGLMTFLHTRFVEIFCINSVRCMGR